MSDYPSLDASLKQLAAHDIVHDPSDFMDGVWQRAGQLGEVADRRRRAAGNQIERNDVRAAFFAFDQSHWLFTLRTMVSFFRRARFF